ncbi:AAA family ATPase [Pseudomonas alliivorans]|nr:AAA family ATPase [Pseudomonas alliivorans]
MITGLLLRNFKTYQSINYIPISNGSMFSAIVGENGSGKSSVLEALDSFFNNTEWNLHHTLTKGFSEREPYICPIFLIERESLVLEESHAEYLELLSSLTWLSTPQEFNSSPKAINEFCTNRAMLFSRGYSAATHFLFPLGLLKISAAASPSIYFSIFESLDAFSHLKSMDDWGYFTQSLLTNIIATYQYIYIPSDINFKEYTKIEGKTVQALLGKKIDEIVRGIIKKTTITDINQKLTTFLAGISKTLENYEYRKPAKKQNLFNQSHLTEKVIDAFFDTKILTKTVGKESVPVTNLSSGEKRQALIDIARAFLLEIDRPKERNVIFAIDEPELSLHISACFEQFGKLLDISKAGVQTILTTHWYGFMPIVSEGVAIYCPKIESELVMIDLRCFREDIAKLRKATNGKLPSDIELKGLNDLVQSIIASVTGADYKWIICEGSADKIYLDFYLSRKKLFILPVGGSKYVKKIFRYLEMALEENKDDIKGRVILLLDTDKAFERYEANDSIEQIKIRRIHNDNIEYKTVLKTTTNNEYYPPTVIEDTLIPEHFVSALETFAQHKQYGELVSALLDAIGDYDLFWPAALSFDLTGTQQKIQEDLFKLPGFKVQFALAYASIAEVLDQPSWMSDVEKFLYPAKRRIRASK